MRLDDEEEEVPIKRRGPYRTKKCSCPFKLKGEQITTCENWQLFIHDGRHNHAIGVYNHSHAQATKPTEEQLIQTKQFRKGYVRPHNILRFFRKQYVGCAMSAQKIYNVLAKIKKNRMQGRNMVKEVLYLSAQWGYTPDISMAKFYRKCPDSNLFSDIVVAHPTSIQIMRTWPYVLIMDMMCKTNKPDFLHYFFNTLLNPLAHKFVRVWTGQIIHFGVETTNRVESEHSVLKLWLSTCHGDLDTVFLNIDWLIEGHIAYIKSSLEFSRLKEKFSAKTNPILKNVSNKNQSFGVKEDIG
ncbi:hypothetical protein M9H77_04142 [Catharanthus roseus]|uniref:Uncharacterized protein n=1 Tax=Catharanthus roseus TaxID=4058 RepID=A0ACC0CDF1_CATRO|nr:hypothetical protein M9H77_04142 [Catharanthus roseus]